MRLSVVCWIIVLAAALPAIAEEAKKSNQTRVLLVTGVEPFGHEWRETAPAIRKVLEKDKRFDVRIVEDPEFLAAVAISDYDLIFLHFKDSRPLSRFARVRENLTNHVQQGKGMVVFHSACAAFEDWPEFSNLAGRVWNRDPAHSHDPRGPFTVQIVQPQQPIMQGMRDFETDDELYICLVGDRPIQVWATARSKVTGKDHPMAFGFEYDKGRVFHTTLGHDVRAIEMPGTAELIRRGCLWAANQPLHQAAD